MVEEKAYAKINLLLAVTEKRTDGFHELRTVFQSLALHDTLTFSHNDTEAIRLSCINSSLPTGPDNLVWRAAKRLQSYYGIKKGVHITLEKQIPVAAGLGGGSSDAAATLRGLIRFWQLPTILPPLLQIAADLGSDIPFCLEGGTALGEGRGEKLTQLPPCPHFEVVLANPGFGVSTYAIYQGLDPLSFNQTADLEGMINAITARDREGVCARLHNTLESSTFRLYPAVNALKTQMGLLTPALMCGSGPTVFALLPTVQAAQAVKKVLEQAGMQAWCTQTKNDQVIGGGMRV